jgi:F0F1-type ATP synthase delta subunit
MFYSAKNISQALIKLSQEYPADKVSQALIKFCQKNQNFNQLNEILKYLKIEQTELKESEKIKLITHEKISESIAKDLKKYIGVSEDESFENIQQKDIQGGFVVKMGNKIIDGSLKHQLEKLQDELI